MQPKPTPTPGTGWPFTGRRGPQERRHRGAAEITLQARRYGREQRQRRGRA